MSSSPALKKKKNPTNSLHLQRILQKTETNIRLSFFLNARQQTVNIHLDSDLVPFFLIRVTWQICWIVHFPTRMFVLWLNIELFHAPVDFPYHISGTTAFKLFPLKCVTENRRKRNKTFYLRRTVWLYWRGERVNKPDNCTSLLSLEANLPPAGPYDEPIASSATCSSQSGTSWYAYETEPPIISDMYLN